MPADTIDLAQYLIGKVFVHIASDARRVGRIVETEAYPPGDPAAHHFIGRTTRNASSFLKRGHAYVYFSYGIHWCLNVTSEATDVGGAVLIRALEPIEGLLRSADGPGKLTVAMEIDRRFDGVDLCGRGALWLGAIDRPVGRLIASPRIGITKAAVRPWRFFEEQNHSVSRRAKIQ